MERYDHTHIEKKWHQQWEKEKIYETSDTGDGENYYALVEFAYPSGNLHVGHWYAFSVPDMYARYMRMRGKNVLFPFGFDSFGLPAENAAIKRGLNPRDWTHQNIEYMRGQLGTMGNMFDWSREVVTSDPAYYRWTQWLFLKLFESGLVYHEDAPANWCPSCKTVLANEQVVGGLCERCSSEVEQKEMKQWMLKITDYADRLLEDLDTLDWPEPIKEAQRNWIGKNDGAELSFEINQDLSEYDFLLLHAYRDTSEDAYIPWLVDELLKKSATNITTLDLPGGETPDVDEQMRFVQENYEFTDKTVVVTHSLSGPLMLKLLPDLDTKIYKLVLVAPPLNTDLADSKPRPALKKYCDWQFDFDAVKPKAASIIVLADRNDPTVPDEHTRTIAEKLGATYIREEAQQGHFNASEEPVVLNAVIPTVQVFTTRPDTLFGATYLVLAPEHPFVSEQIRNSKSEIQNKEEVRKYIEKTRRKTELERQENRDKTGVELRGVKAINPGNGKEIPLWVADYVLNSVGTGAIMAVPAHDERDYEFAKKFNVPITEVITGGNTTEAAYEGEGTLMNSGEFDGMDSTKAREKVTEAVGGSMSTTYRLRDWLVSRQRYWGCPIPIIHCKECGTVQVPEKELPVELPDVDDYLPSGDGKSPLAKVDDFVNVQCPKCGGEAKRETDTLDTFVDSSWYFLRYTDPHNKKDFANSEKQKLWMPVDFYSGGAEHTTMHLLYSRFFQKALYDLDLVKNKEPYKRRMNRGIILGPDGQKMSKSKGNVVDPDEVVSALGADTVRLYLAFIGPYKEVGHYPWSIESIKGVRRFLDRVWKFALETKDQKRKTEDKDQRRAVEIELHKTIKQVGESIESMKMNTGVAALMSFLNVVEREGIHTGQFKVFVQLLAPFAPHIAEELWREFLGQRDSVHVTSWPTYDEDKLAGETVRIAVQINGKTRDELEIVPGASQKEVEKDVFALESTKKWTAGKKVSRVVYIPDRLVNIVLD